LNIIIGINVGTGTSVGIVIVVGTSAIHSTGRSICASAGTNIVGGNRTSAVTGGIRVY
jgi:hypothetical protein